MARAEGSRKSERLISESSPDHAWCLPNPRQQVVELPCAPRAPPAARPNLPATNWRAERDYAGADSAFLPPDKVQRSFAAAPRPWIATSTEEKFPSAPADPRAKAGRQIARRRGAEHRRPSRRRLFPISAGPSGPGGCAYARQTRDPHE